MPHRLAQKIVVLLFGCNSGTILVLLQYKGIVEDQRKARMDVVVLHLVNLLDEMVGEENMMKERIMKKVNSYYEQLSHLTRELNLPAYEVYNCSVVQSQNKYQFLNQGSYAEMCFRY